MLFAVVFQLVAAFVFIKRPREEAAAVLFLTATSGASYLFIRSLEAQVGEMIHGPHLWLGFIISSAGHRLSATIGQMGAGTSASAHFALSVGLQGGANPLVPGVCLPLVIK